jgi:hypothetical protein
LIKGGLEILLMEKENPLNISQATVSEFLNDVASKLDSDLSASQIHIPSLVVWSMDSKGSSETTVIPVTADMNDHDQKHKAFMDMGAYFGDEIKLPLMACLVSAAWAAAAKEGDDKTPPSQHQDRKEVILVSAMSINRICLSSLADVTGNKIEGFCKPFEGENNLLFSFYMGYQEKVFERVRNPERDS